MIDKELFQLPDDRSYSEAEVVELLTEQLRYLLDARRDWVLGKLYRLDVRERDIKAALAQPGVDVAAAFARLILERQAEKKATRERYAR